MKQSKKTAVFSGLPARLILTAIFGGVYFYVMLPAINLKAPDFWAFLIILVLFYIFITLLTSGARMYAGGNVIFMSRTVLARCKMPLVLLGVLCLAAVIGAVYSSEIFHAKEYYNLLDVQTGDFTEEVAEISYDKIPMLDKDSSVQLGSRALGSLSSTDSNLVSQFEVSDLEESFCQG